MDKANKVYFKATKDNIIVMLDKDAKFDELRDSLGIKAKQARKFFGDISASIIFRGRILDGEEEAVLVRTIEEETNLKVYVVEDRPETADKAERQPLTGLIAPRQEKNAPSKSMNDIFNISTAGGMEGAVFHKKSLRSGQSIVTEASVIILGDVNPGGEIVAGGNIVVLGALKGLAHAGAYGNRDTFVAAIALQPVQLRIANMISTVAEELTKQKKSGAPIPSYAFIEEDQIWISPLQ